MGTKISLGSVCPKRERSTSRQCLLGIASSISRFPARLPARLGHGVKGVLHRLAVVIGENLDQRSRILLRSWSKGCNREIIPLRTNGGSEKPVRRFRQRGERVSQITFEPEFAVLSTPGHPGPRRPRLSPWTYVMAVVCVSLCREQRWRDAAYLGPKHDPTLCRQY